MMLLSVHIHNGAKHIMNINSMTYDKEVNAIWLDTAGASYQGLWISEDYISDGGLWIDDTTLQAYRISVWTIRDSVLGNLEARGHVEDLYDSMEKELMVNGKVYLEFHTRVDKK